MGFVRRWATVLEGDEGATAVMTAILLVAMIGFIALVVDVGSLYAERRSLQTAADAGALAGVQDLRPPSPVGNSAAQLSAGDYVTLNSADASQRDIAIGTTYAPNDTIRISIANPTSQLFFARLWGMSSSSVPAAATAIVESPSAFGHGVMPFGIMAKDATGTMSPFGYAFNQSVTLKESSQNGTQGNFQFMSLTDPPGAHVGANDVRGAISGGGVPNPVYMGSEYNTRTGINGRNVINSLSSWIGGDSHSISDVVSPPDASGIVKFIENPGEPHGCHRIIVCPIIVNPAFPEGDPNRYSWQEINGSKPALVVGFAYFFIESWGGGGGQDCWITGRFIRPITEEALDYGGVNQWGALHFTLLH